MSWTKEENEWAENLMEKRIRQKTIKNVYVINGMAVVFNEEGEQMPEYQGEWEEKKDIIKANNPKNIHIQY